MSRLTRVRSLAVAAATEVNRIWRGARPRGVRHPRWRFLCDPLEARIMLAAPVLSTVPDQTTDEAKTISVCASFTDADGPAACSNYTASINWGDGTCSWYCPCSSNSMSLSACGPCPCSCSSAWAGTISATHAYADNRPGNQAYTATLTLSDGGSTASKTFAVTVRDVPPTLTMGGAATVSEGGSYTLTLARSDRGTDTLSAWSVNWGDNSPPQSVSSASATTTVSHTFAAGVGRPNITVTATDEDGGPYSARKTSVDTGFGTNGIATGTSLGRMQALAVQSDGKIIAAFGNGGFGIDKDFIVARYLSNGTLDPSFGTVSGSTHLGYTAVDFGSSSSDYASSIAIVNVGGTDRILVAGSRSSGTTSNDFAVLRFNASDGSLDTGTTGDATLNDSFGNGGKVAIDFNGGYDFAYGMAIQGDKIVLAGSAAIAPSSNSYDFAVARLNMDGTPDTGDSATGDSNPSDGGFGRYVSGTSGPQTGRQTLDFMSTSNSAYDVAIDVTGKIVVGGTVQTNTPTSSTGNDLAVARFTPDGMVDDTFGPLVPNTTVHQGWSKVDVRSTNDNARAILIQSDGKIVVGGSSEAATGDLTDFALARWNADGSLDDGSANDLDPSDRFGTSTTPPNPGTVLTNFAHGSDEAMRAILQVDGRLVAVGYSTSIYNGTDFAAARYMPDGTLDPTFGDGGKLATDGGTSANDVGYAAALQLDGKIVVGGVRGTSTAMTRYQPSSTLQVTVVPNAPTGLTIGLVDVTTVDLSWTDGSQVETGFVIEASTDSGTTFTTVGTAAANATQVMITSLAPATLYRFRVRAVNGAAQGAPSGTADATTASTPSGFTADDLTATATIDGKVELRWLDDAAGEDGFRVLRSTQPDQNFIGISNLQAGQTRYTDADVQSNKTYYYRVLAYASGANGQPSNTASATTAIASSQTWALVDTVNVPVNGSTILSHVVLSAGWHYQLRAAGNFHLGGWDDGRADAEYADFTRRYDLHPIRGVDYGIAIDDPTLDSNKYPYWGDYAADHTYAIDFVGHGTSINLNYHDDNYGDNQLDQGSMTLEIWRASGPTGSVTGEVWLDANRNARLDADASGPLESGSGGHRVYADLNKDGQWESAEPSSISASDGSYVISGVPAGPNTLRVVPASGYWVLSPLYGAGRMVDLADGQTLSDVDFGVANNNAPVLDPLAPDTLYIDPYAPVPRNPKVIWTKGDLLVSTFPDKLLQQYRPDGSHVQTRPEVVNGNMQFDANGDLIAVQYDDNDAKLVRYSGIDGSAQVIADDLQGPTAVEADVFGNVYVATRGLVDQQYQPFAGGIFKYDRSGNVIGHWLDTTPIDAFDLSADQHTILYASATADRTTITAYDLNTGDSHVFANGLVDVLGIRVLADGRVLVTNESSILLFNAEGTHSESYDTAGPNQWLAANVDPDGLSFWAADGCNPRNSLPEWQRGSGQIVRFDIASHKVLTVVDGLATIDQKVWSPTAIPDRGPRSAAVYGGATGATPPVGKDFVYRVTATDVDNDPLTYQLLGDTYGASIDPGTGVFRWTPTTPGTYTFTVRVTDALGAWDQRAFDVHVQPLSKGDNHAPVIQTSALSDAVVGNPYQNRVLAADADGDRLTYSVVNSPGVRIDAETGIFTFVPTSDDQTRGYKAITVRVTDARAATVQTTLRITVRAATTHGVETPTIDPQAGEWRVQVGQTGQFRITTPYAGSTATMFGISLLPGMRLSRPLFNDYQHMDLTWTPTAAQVGQHVIRIGLGDAYLGTLTERDFTLIVDPASTPIDGSGSPLVLSPLWISAVVNQEFNGIIATFVDASPASDISKYRVAIDWGDGDETPGTLFPRGDGVYEVRGDHTYKTRGLSTQAIVKVYKRNDTGPETLRASAMLDADVSESSLETPTGVIVTALSQNQVQVRWNPVRGADGYVVRRFNPDGSVIDLPDPLHTTSSPYYDSTATAGTRYGYQVLASDVHRTFSVPSPIVYVTTHPITVPDQPGNLVATAVSLSAIRLAWSDPKDHTIQGWDILRAESANGTYTSIFPSGQVVADAEYVDTGLAPNQHYWYKIVAVGTGPGAPRSVPYGPADAATTVATAPQNLAGGYAGYYADSNARRVGLKWDAVDGAGILGYDIYRGTTSNFALNASTLIGSSADPRYTDDIVGDSAATGKIYYYAVRAVYAGFDGGETSSDPSMRISVDARGELASAAPAAPSAINVTENAPDHVTLTWQDNSLNEAGFDIYRTGAGNTGPGMLIGRVTADAVSYTDNSVEAGGDYDYRVFAYNRDHTGESAPYHVVVSTAGPAPASPTNLRADTTTTNYEQIGLRWTAPVSSTPAVTGYYVYGLVHLPGNHDVYVRLTPKPIADTSFVVTQLLAGMTYGYKVTAVSAAGAQSDPLVGSLSTSTAPSIPPIIRITAPLPFDGVNVDFANCTTDDNRIRKVTPVKIIVDDVDPTDTLTWNLLLRPLAPNGTEMAGQDILLASGTSREGSRFNADSGAGGVGVYNLDPSLYPNGNYKVILTASNGHGAADPAEAVVSLFSNNKFGNLVLPATDLTFDMPGGQPIVIKRVYDSTRANERLDFGYGWSLETSNSVLTTTAAASSNGKSLAFKQGDVVYINLPDGSQHAFQFFPVPNNYGIQDGFGLNPYGMGYSHYWAQFIAVDGSDATLTVAGDMHAAADDRLDLVYDPDNQVYRVTAGINGQGVGDTPYDPALPQFGGKYVVTMADRTSYSVDGGTGAIEWQKDANGNATYYGPNSINEGNVRVKIDRDGHNQIEYITLLNASGHLIRNPIVYTYNADGTLRQVKDGADTRQFTARYNYTDAHNPYLLTKVIDARNVVTFKADYDDSGRLTSLRDAGGAQLSAGAENSDGSRGGRAVIDPTPQHDSSENIYDVYGNVVRRIRTITNNGTVTGYQVTVSEYDMFNGGVSDELLDIFDPSSPTQKQPGVSQQNTLAAMREYAPFFVSGTDPDPDARYHEAPTHLVRQTKFSQGGNRMPMEQVDYLDPVNAGDPNRRITTFTDYDHGKPGTVTVTLVREDTAGNRVPIGAPSKTQTYYDARGNVEYTFTVAPDGSKEGTHFVYSDGQDGLPAGRLLDSYKVTAIGGAPLSHLVHNEYYSATETNTASGQYPGQLKLTQSGGGRATHYSYDALGRVTRTYYLWDNPMAGQPDLWVVNTNHEYYELGGGRVTRTTQAIYQDGGSAGVLNLSSGPNLDSNGNLPIDETPANGVPTAQAERQTAATHYDALGRVATTTDQFLADTINTYDLHGNLIRVQYPDNTETLSVYDEMGRVTWQTDRFATTGHDYDPVPGTHTIYDSLGRVTLTERYANVEIDRSVDGSVEYGDGSDTPQVFKTSLIDNTADADHPRTRLSAQGSIYDSQGRVFETDRYAGTSRTPYSRSGTVYHNDGRAKYAGPLKVDTVDWDGADLSKFQSYTTYLYDQFDSAAGLFYDRVIDGRGHRTDTFKDSQGRVVKTAFDDGSFTQTLFGVND